METIRVEPKTRFKSEPVLNFLKKMNVKSNIYKEPTKKQVLIGIERGTKETSLYLKGNSN
jgi:hypothetical protein